MGAIFGIIGRYQESDLNKMMDTLSYRSKDKNIKRFNLSNGFLVGLGPQNHDLDPENTFDFVLDGYLSIGKHVENISSIYQLLDSCTGLHAAAAFDRSTQKLYLFRDPAGAHPLYWHLTPENKFIFASSPRAILQITSNPQINPIGLYHFLSMITPPDPETIFKDIYALRPGYILTFSSGKIDIEPYWKPQWSQADSPVKNIDILAQNLRTVLELSIHNAVPANVDKTGFFLSGGTDTSAVVGLAAKAGFNPIQTFTIGYRGKSREYSFYNEFEYAKLVADHYGTKHTEIYITPDNLLESLPKILFYMDQPSGDAINSFLVSETIPDFIDTVMTGTGGDEIFIGSHWFRQQAELIRKYELWMKIPSFMRLILEKYARGKSSSKLAGRITAAVALSEGVKSQYKHIKFVFHENEKQRMLSRDFLQTIPPNTSSNAIVDLYDSDQANSDSVNRMMALLFKHEVSNLQLRDLDAMCAAHHLEARSPLVDRPVLETLAAIPGYVKAPEGKLRFLMFEALKDVLLEKTKTRRKMSFIVPMDIWAHHELKSVIYSVLSSESIKKRKIFNPDEIHRILDEYYKKQIERHPFKVWNLAVFELWCRVHIDNPGSGIPETIDDLL